jgi:hypothetical protein
MANRYWIGGSGSWTDTAHWSDTSNGSGGFSAPGTSDTAYFDANSGSGTVTLNQQSVGSIDSTGASGLTLSGSSWLFVYGTTMDLSGVTWTHTGYFAFRGGGTVELTCGGNTFGSTETRLYDSTTLKLMDKFRVVTFNFTAGTLNPNGQEVEIVVGGGVSNLNGANSFYDLTITGSTAKTGSCNIYASITVSNTFTATGNSNRLLVVGPTESAATITAATVSLTNVDFRYITGAGTGTWSGTSVGNAGGNTDITFTSAVTRYWVGNGGNWDDTSHWSDSSGGSSGSSVPLVHDTVVFDSNSITTTGQTIALDTMRVPDLDFSGLANSTALSGVVYVYGGECDFTNCTGSINLEIWNYSNTSEIDFGGLTSLSGFNLYGTTSSLLTSQSDVPIITSGGNFYRPFDLNHYDFYSSSGYTTFASSFYCRDGTLTFSGTGTIIGNGGGLVGGGTAYFVISDTSGGSKWCNFSGMDGHTLTITGNNVYIRGTNTWNTIAVNTAGLGTGVRFDNPQTCANFTTNGSSGNLARVFGGSLTKTGDVVDVDYMNISGVTGNPDKTWFVGANSTDGGSNTMIYFYGPPVEQEKTCTAKARIKQTITVSGSGLVDSYSETNKDLDLAMLNYSTYLTKVGQSFTGNGGTLSSCKFYMKQSGSGVSGTYYARLYAHSGTYGTSSLPTGDALAISDGFDVSTLTGTLQLIEFTFSGANKVTLENGTKYVITFEFDSGTTGAYIVIGCDNSSPTHSGNLSNVTYVGGSWAAFSSRDLIFYVYYESSGISAKANIGSPPTVTLGTPADSATVNDSTPDFTFTGTDENSDDVEYNIEIFKKDLSYSTFVRDKLISEDSSVRGLAFSTDGTKMFVSGLTNPESLYQYSLSTPWDISTLSYDSKSFDPSTYVSLPWEIFFSDDGNNLYISDTSSAKINQFSLGTAWDITTTTYVGYYGISNVRSAYLTSDGKTLFVNSANQDTIRKFTLGTDYDISTASYDFVSKALTEAGTYYRFTFSSDGKKIWANNYNNRIVYQYSLSVAFDITSATYDSVTYDYSSIDSGTCYPFDVSPDGHYFYYWSPDDYKLNQISMLSSVVNAYSETDSGFTPGHPFASDTEITYSYTATSLTEDTYYWRVRAIAPLGSNVWGNWTADRPFTIQIISKSITAKSAIKRTTSRTSTSKARIKNTGITKTLSAKASILIPFSTETKTATSRARVQFTRDKTSQARSRIKHIDLSNYSQAKSRILSIKTKTATTKARIKQIDLSNYSEAKARVKNTGVIKTLSSKSRIKIVNVEKTITARGRIQFTRDKTATSKARINVIQTETASAKSRIKNTFDKSATTKSRIKVIDVTKTLSSKARVQKLFEKTATAKANILVEYTKTATAKANIFVPRVAKVELVSPTHESSGGLPVIFIWEIPRTRDGENVHFVIQVDDTDDTFSNIELEQKSWLSQANIEYWDGDSWEAFPSNGVSQTYVGNQVRLTVSSLEASDKWWRVRGCIV